MKAKNNENIQEYLHFAEGQKEVSLMIAENTRESGEFEKALQASGFLKNGSVAELMKNLKKTAKNYLVLEADSAKSAYDFLIQYPTGQIEIFDEQSMESSMATPDYRKQAVVYLATRDILLKIKNHGYDLLQHAGLTYKK